MAHRPDPKTLTDLLPGQPQAVPDGHFRDEAGRKDITKVMGWISFCVLILLAAPYVFDHPNVSKMQVPAYVIAPFALLSCLTFFKDTLMGLKAFALIQTAYQPGTTNISSEGGQVAATADGNATAEQSIPNAPAAPPAESE
jgi:hypothetical protein